MTHTFLRLLVAGVSGPGRHKTPKTVAQTVAQTVATRQPLLQAADALLERSLAALPIARAVGEVAVAAVATEDAVLAAFCTHVTDAVNGHRCRAGDVGGGSQVVLTACNAKGVRRRP